jgi:hypothetical protein
VKPDAQRLYQLLPAIHRIRDLEQGGPLRELLSVIEEQVALLEENLDQLYDDEFIETCADWVVPYIGDLIGYRALHGTVPTVSSPRAEVGNTIALRRRKGTAAMLEQLARDVTGLPAHVVEFFQLLATTQYMNHLRPDKPYTVDFRRWEPLERLGTPFDTLGHTIDVRRIATSKGLHNIPNIGLFLWRLQAYRLKDSPAIKVDARRFLFSPLGDSTQLFTRPISEDRITHLTEPVNVPLPISRRVLHADQQRWALDDTRSAYYGTDKSLSITADGVAVPLADVRACNLSDSGSVWAHQPTSIVAIDPVLGRIAFPANKTPPTTVVVTFHYGFSADMGGGSYERTATFAALEPGQVLLRVPQDRPTIQAALNENSLKNNGGVVEITNSGRYVEALDISVAANKSIELRAANECRPTLVLTQDLKVTGGAGAAVTLNGLLITAAPGAPASSPGIVKVPAGANQLQRLRLRHCTLVPGLFLDIDGKPQRPNQASLVVEQDLATVELDRSILGGVRIAGGSELLANDSIIDSTAISGVAYAGLDGKAPGGPVTLQACTVVGKVHAEVFKLVSNSIMFAELAGTGAKFWKAPVWAARKQEGCVRFSYLPRGSIVPRRYRCQPDFEIAAEIVRQRKVAKISDTEAAAIGAEVEAWLVPAFTTLLYGVAAYAQLTESCSYQIRTGADDESEMGAFHGLYQPQRETNLRVRLDEYLRFGLEAGIFAK